MTPDFQHPQTEYEDEANSASSWYAGLCTLLFFVGMLLWLVLTRKQVLIVLLAIFLGVLGVWLDPPAYLLQHPIFLW